MKTLLSTYLNELHIPFTASYADKLFVEHPHKYNLYGLSDMLAIYKIPNTGVQVDDKELSGFTTPFIAHVSNDFVVVKRINGEMICYIWRGKHITVSVEEFKRLWSGIALIAEPKDNSTEPEYEKHKGRDLFISVQKLGLIIMLVVILGLGYFENHSFFH